MKFVIRFVPVLCMYAALLPAQDIDKHWSSLPAPPNNITGGVATARKPAKSAVKSAFVFSTDIVFPHIAAGGGWETVLVIANMTERAVQFRTLFYSQSGQPMTLTLKSYPDGQSETGSGFGGRLPVGASFNFVVSDPGATKVGWAVLDYDTTDARLGGYAIFRQKVEGRTAVAEALVPLSSYDDSTFMMPFDNLQGFDTAMAMVNPASNVENIVKFLFLAQDSTIIGRGELTLPAGGHKAFLLRDQFPNVALANRVGTILVDSDINRLSALGLRFNSSGTFTSIPILTW